MANKATLLDKIPEETRDRLRALTSATEDFEWPGSLARRQGWLVANRAYHAVQRMLGKQEMVELLDELGLRRPLPAELAREALLAAVELYLHIDEAAGEVQDLGDCIDIAISRCPAYSQFERSNSNIPPCGCFARIYGWHDALGSSSDVEMTGNLKWGDAACRMRLHWPRDAET